jgi:threonine dehydrogenase-like Zn-dependent dehydrogenase
MKTLVCTQPGNFEYQDASKPEVKDGFSLLRIRRIGICGTDLHAFEGTQPFFEYPRILVMSLLLNLWPVMPPVLVPATP